MSRSKVLSSTYWLIHLFHIFIQSIVFSVPRPTDRLQQLTLQPQLLNEFSGWKRSIYHCDLHTTVSVPLSINPIYSTFIHVSHSSQRSYITMADNEDDLVDYDEEEVRSVFRSIDVCDL